MIENTWVNQTLWGYHQTHFDRPNTEFGGLEGWISYITKSSELSEPPVETSPVYDPPRIPDLANDNWREVL